MLIKTLTFLTMTFITLFVIWLLGLLWFATNVTLAQPKDIDVKTDAVIVLTGATNRIDEGIALLIENKSDLLFISGVNENVQDVSMITTHKGTIPCCVELGYKATDTKGNAIEAKEWLESKKRDKKIETIRLVTSNYHMMRSMLEFKKTFKELRIIPHAVAPKGYAPWKKEFWAITFSEYNKTLLIALQFNQS